MNRVFSELSEREDDVAQMYGLGLEVKEIASKSFKSAATIRNQMQSIYAKLEVRNRSELSIKMMERIFSVKLRLDDSGAISNSVQNTDFPNEQDDNIMEELNKLRIENALMREQLGIPQKGKTAV